jgi:uncharacterized lipoprotein YajG
VTTVRLLVFSLVSAALLCACGLRALEDQQVVLAPVLTVSPLDVGNGTRIAVSVTDERDTSVVGYRGWAYGDAATITISRDITMTIAEHIRQGLLQHGFAPVDGNQRAPVDLEVEIRLIEYNVTQGWDFALHTRATMKAIALKNGRVFDKIFRVENEKRVVIVPPDETNSEVINGAVSEVINDLVNDRDLMTFMADGRN